MVQQINSNPTEAMQASTAISSGVSEYSSVKLKTISSSAPVQESSAHDGMGSSIQKTMQAWSALIKSDAKAIQDTSSTLAGADKNLARKLLSVGE